MASVTIAWGTRATYANITNLDGQPTGQLRTIGAVDATATTPANPCGFKLDYVLKTGTTATTSGTATFYLIESADGGTNYTDQVNVATTTDQAAKIKNAVAIRTVKLDAATTTFSDTFDLPRQFTPKSHTIAVLNSSGGSLSTGGNSLAYTPITYTVA
jgi:hypothetical protein